MKTSEFNKILDSIGRLAPSQRDRLSKRLAGEDDAVAAVQLIENSAGEHPACPHCGGKATYRWGTSGGLQRYQCRHCQRTFNALTGTPLAKLRHKGKWLGYGQKMIEGLSIRKAAKECGIAKNTSFKWRHCFLKAPDSQQPAQLSGIIEADETFFLESFKGKRYLPRPARKRGGAAAKKGTSAEQIPVLVVRDRHGDTADYILPGLSAADIEPVLKPLLAKDAVLCSDGGAVYKIIARKAGVAHCPVNLSKGLRVLGGVFHIQNVNAYDSRLKQWMERFHGVASGYLGNYLAWHRMLDCLGEASPPSAWLVSAIGREKYFQQLTAT